MAVHGAGPDSDNDVPGREQGGRSSQHGPHCLDCSRGLSDGPDPTLLPRRPRRVLPNQRLWITPRLRSIQVCLGSVDRVPFADSSFDVVWCEGALYVLGFQESVRVWRRLLRPGGVLVAHDEAGNVNRKKAEAEAGGFTVLSTFDVSENEWWSCYYGPAAEEQHLADSFRDELRRFDAEPHRFRSAFFLLQVPARSDAAPADPLRGHG